jgi:hypothetical protein
MSKSEKKSVQFIKLRNVLEAQPGIILGFIWSKIDRVYELVRIVLSMC